jgi:protein transport protein SEC24
MVLDRNTIMINLMVVVSKAYTGGHVVSFVCTLPEIGLGRLVPLEHSNRDESLDDKKFFVSRDIEWNNLGEACADAGVGVSMFVAPTKFLDVGSIGMSLHLRIAHARGHFHH